MIKHTLIILFVFTSPIIVLGQTNPNRNDSTSMQPRRIEPVTPANPDDSNFGSGDAQSGETSPEDTQNKPANILAPLINYNFTGSNKALGNITPVVDYGWNRNIHSSVIKRKKDGSSKGDFTINLSLNPYIGSQINIKDSTSFLPALMLYGNAGLRINLSFNLKFKNVTIGIAPVNFGYKLISNFTDSSSVIHQHNLRHGLVFQYTDLLILSAQLTNAWHNATSESDRIFKKALNTNFTDFQYLTLTLQTRLFNRSLSAPTFLFVEWRGLLNKRSYQNYPNDKIMSIGIRTDLNIDQALPARSPRRPPSSTM